MSRTTRILKLIGVSLAAVVGVALAAVYGISQWHLSRTYDQVPLGAFRASGGDAALIAEGERLARTRGCFGCHGQALEGRVFVDEPWMARIVAPNLTQVVTEYTDAELERLIRRGVRRDGKGVWVMASNMYYHLSDDDLRTIVAYLRSLPPRQGLPLEMDMRLLGRVGLAIGMFPSITSEIDLTAPRLAADRADPVVFGRYLALTSCTECHGPGLEGGPDTPDLRIVAAYTPEQFTRFMRTGLALGNRDTGFMSGVARARFSHLTDEEITALYTYLRQRAAE